MSLTNSHEVIKRISAELFSAEERRLAQAREQLIASNKELYRDRPHDGFTYKGVVYDPVGLIKGKRSRVSLHIALEEPMEAYLKDIEQVWGDRYYISQMLFKIMQPCSSTQDLRDALPNCIVDTLSELRTLPRTRPEAYTIEHCVRTMRQFKKVLPRIEFYSASRLLY